MLLDGLSSGTFLIDQCPNDLDHVSTVLIEPPVQACQHLFSSLFIRSIPTSLVEEGLTLRQLNNKITPNDEVNFKAGIPSVQITSYFVALATPQTAQVVIVVDKVGGTEKCIQQSDVEGSTVVKLDLSLATPIIFTPRLSKS